MLALKIRLLSCLEVVFPFAGDFEIATRAAAWEAACWVGISSHGTGCLRVQPCPGKLKSSSLFLQGQRVVGLHVEHLLSSQPLNNPE